MKSGRFEISDMRDCDEDESKYPCLQGRRNKMVTAGVIVLIVSLVTLLVFLYCTSGNSKTSSQSSDKFTGGNKTKPGPVNINSTQEANNTNLYEQTNLESNETELPSNTKEKCDLSTDHRFDCLPRGSATEDECKKRGCCWRQEADTRIPTCFYPTSYAIYHYTDIKVSHNGIQALMSLDTSKRSPYKKDVQLVQVDVIYKTATELQVKISDARANRYEPRYPKINEKQKQEYSSGSDSTAPLNLDYSVEILKEKLGFKVLRNSSGEILFDSQSIGGFIFSDQLIQFTSLLPSKYIYGLGHQRNDFKLSTDWEQITLFNHDCPPADKKNLYSSHPFYLVMENSGSSHGFFLFNSNAMDIILQPAPAITFRVTGGVLDMYFFLGPSPSQVIEQYTGLIGRPILPPYWALGFHLSRFGYKTVNATKTVLENNRNVEIPVDTQWNDLDYMKDRNTFTYDNITFGDLPEFVEYLHGEGMHYVMIVDPGVSAGEKEGTYPPYDQGLEKKVFIMDDTGKKPFVGQVWNLSNKTVFPDFTNPVTQEYWKDQLNEQHKNQFQFDGVWLDMNEPSNFLNGGFGDTCPDTTWDNPPYLPNVDGGKLYAKTICMSAIHHDDTLHYNVHNVYGFAETVATKNAMEEIRGNRTLIITRSSFPGVGSYAGTWTGDVSSTWEDMKHSVADILSFSLFGIPLVGADICGFNGDTSVPLCTRWSQLGAFYPFSRNHNSDDQIAQDPFSLGEAVVESARKALQTRYHLLPYLYTLFYDASKTGSTVVRPLFFEFPNDVGTYSLQEQFLWGAALLIVPVLKENIMEADVYLPKGVWYNYYTFKKTVSKGNWETSDAVDKIPLLLRGGFIIPTQEPGLTTTQSRKNKMGLIVASDEKNMANGSLYWDDGEGLPSSEETSKIEFTYLSNEINSIIAKPHGDKEQIIGSITILGVDFSVTNVTVNNTVHGNFTYDQEYEVLKVSDLELDLNKQFTIKWN